MKILLHICCAPCSIHPFSELLKNKFSRTTGFFYNPNIHPPEEYEKRRKALLEYSEKNRFDVIFNGYEPEVFFQEIGTRTEIPERCNICWRMRLAKTAEYAKNNGFDSFTTTLLASPYQSREEIIKIGAECQKVFGVEFIVGDFRGGFREAQQKAKEQGIYRQRYCGCVYSQKK